MEAIVLAGGFGTRLQSVVSDVPKPMADVSGKPFLAYVLQNLNAQGISKVVLSVGYKYQVIESYFGKKYSDMALEYVVEDTPLGTGGAIKKSLEKCSSSCVAILNGDTFFDVDLNKMKSAFDSECADLMLSLKPMQCFDRYGTVLIDQKSRVIGFTEKQYCSEGLINGGVYIASRNLLSGVVESVFSFENFMSENLLNRRFFSMIFDNYFIDIGIPEDYYKAQHELLNVV